MKIWLQVKLEKDDPNQCCVSCNAGIIAPDSCFVEFILRQGGLPNIDELHPDLTGQFLCSKCGKDYLI